MPRIMPRNPNADDNDPLWPKAFKWPGGRALAPQRPAPPMPQGIEPELPNELAPYIVNPDNRPATPPKGDVQTGEKIGPAYTKLPRDVQRGAVNSTFDSMVSNARGIQGSVFDTPFDKALRFGSGDSMGGLSPMAMGGAATIVPKRGVGRLFAPSEKRAQALWAKENPKGLAAMRNDKRPGSDYIVDELRARGEKGRTELTRDTETMRRSGPLSIKINPQSYGPETFPHELDHLFAFRRAEFGGGNQPNTALLHELKTRYPEAYKAYMKIAGGDSQHAATYFRADEAARRTGKATTRGSSLIPPKQ